MEKKINDWLNQGIIDKQTALIMLADIKEDKEKSKKIKINITIYTIAVIFIALGIITFIAANNWILAILNASDLLKILLMTGITLASLSGGYKLAYEKKNFPKLGNALIVLSSFLIGGTYALAAQIYNINANSSALLFLWFFSILPLAYLFKSRAINNISIVLLILGIIYFYIDLAFDKGLIWTIFMPLFCGVLLYSAGNIPVVLKNYNDFSLVYKITGSLPIFIIFLVLTCSVQHSYHTTSPYYIVPIILLALLNIINYICKKEINTLFKIETISTITILLILLLMLILPNVYPLSVMIIANVLIIAMIVFGFNYGYKFENGKIISVTNIMLVIYLTINYCRWGWSFMNKSLFFILGGICLLSLGLYLENKRKKITRKDI